MTSSLNRDSFRIFWWSGTHSNVLSQHACTFWGQTYYVFDTTPCSELDQQHPFTDFFLPDGGQKPCEVDGAQQPVAHVTSIATSAPAPTDEVQRAAEHAAAATAGTARALAARLASRRSRHAASLRVSVRPLPPNQSAGERPVVLAAEFRSARLSAEF